MSNRTIQTMGTLALCLNVLGGFLVPFFSAAYAAPPPASVAKPSPLTEDARLERTISIEEIGIPLNELLHKLSLDKLTLTCDRYCKDWKLQIRLKQRPLRTLMDSLAQLLPGEWVALEDKSGYRLEMDSAAIARREKWWRLFLGEREKALAAQRAFILQKMRGEPYRRKPDDPNPANSDLAVEERVAQQHEFFRSLPAVLQERIANQMDETPYYSTGSLDFGTYNQEGALYVPLSELSPEAQEKAHQIAFAMLSPHESPDVLNDLFVNFTNGGFVLMAGITLPDGRTTGTSFSLHIDTSPNALTLLLDHRQLADVVRQMGRTAPDTWKQLAAYQQSRFWKEGSPDPKPYQQFHAKRVATLQWLGEKNGLEYVSDHYWNGGRVMNADDKERDLKRALKEELNALALDTDISWKPRADNIYLFRNNRWYRDDYLEVPAPLLRRWYALRFPPEPTEEQGKPKMLPTVTALLEKFRKQMDWEAELVTTLTPWQITVGLRAYTPFTVLTDALKYSAEKRVQVSSPEMLNKYNPRKLYPFLMETVRIMREYRMARFYAELNSAARTALFEGRLPFVSLTPSQREQAVYLLPRLQILLKQRTEEPILIGLQPTGGFPKPPVFDQPIPACLTITSPLVRTTSPSSTP